MFDAYLHEIAAAYDALPEGLYSGPYGDMLSPGCQPETVAGTRDWSDLANDSVFRAKNVRLLLDVSETDDPEPYPDAPAMLADIACGRFVVSRAHSEHPIWSEAENVAFRIVHDVLGHYAASVRRGYPAAYMATEPLEGRVTNRNPSVAGFDWEGENLACAEHVRLLQTRGARRALFTECIAQTGYAIDRGGFGPQKVGDCGPLLPHAGTVADGLRSNYAAWLRGEVVA